MGAFNLFPSSHALSVHAPYCSAYEDVTGWGRTEQDSIRYHRAFPNGAQFKTHELFVSGNFHLVFSDLC